EPADQHRRGRAEHAEAEHHHRGDRPGRGRAQPEIGADLVEQRRDVGERGPQVERREGERDDEQGAFEDAVVHNRYSVSGTTATSSSSGSSRRPSAGITSSSTAVRSEKSSTRRAGHPSERASPATLTSGNGGHGALPAPTLSASRSITAYRPLASTTNNAPTP